MTRLSDELIKKLATGSGRCYPHEGQYMAQEIMERRAKEAEEAAAAKAKAAAPSGSMGSIPWPYGPGPLHP